MRGGNYQDESEDDTHDLMLCFSFVCFFFKYGGPTSGLLVNTPSPSVL